MSDNNPERRLRWTQSARRHRIGCGSARYAMERAQPTRTTTVGGANAWLWIGADERGRELEIIAVEIEPDDDVPYLLVIHVMPTPFRGQ